MDPYIGKDDMFAAPGVNVDWGGRNEYDPPGSSYVPPAPGDAPAVPMLLPPAMQQPGYWRQSVNVPRWAAIGGCVALVLLILRR